MATLAELEQNWLAAQNAADVYYGANNLNEALAYGSATPEQIAEYERLNQNKLNAMAAFERAGGQVKHGGGIFEGMLGEDVGGFLDQAIYDTLLPDILPPALLAIGTAGVGGSLGAGAGLGGGPLAGAGPISPGINVGSPGFFGSGIDLAGTGLPTGSLFPELFAGGGALSTPSLFPELFAGGEALFGESLFPELFAGGLGEGTGFDLGGLWDQIKGIPGAQELMDMLGLGGATTGTAGGGPAPFSPLVAGGIGAGLGGLLGQFFEPTGPATTTQAQTSTQQAETGPTALQLPAYQRVAAGLGELAPQQFFPGETVAGRTPFELAGQGLQAGAALGPGAQIGSAAQQALLSQLTAPDLANNPYLQSAIQAAISPTLQAFQEQILPSISSEAIRTGGFGGSRQGVVESQAAERATRQVGDIASQLANQAYLQGLQTQQAGLAAAPSVYNLGLAPGQTLANLGLDERAYQQQLIDAAMQRFQFQQQEPAQFLQRVGQIAGQIPGTAQNVSGFQQTGEEAFSPTNQMLQALAGLSAGGALLGQTGLSARDPLGTGILALLTTLGATAGGGDYTAPGLPTQAPGLPPINVPPPAPAPAPVAAAPSFTTSLPPSQMGGISPGPLSPLGAPTPITGQVLPPRQPRQPRVRPTTNPYIAA